jgi:hypothetical protein
MGPDKAEAEGFGGSKVEADNAVWPHLRRNPEGRGQFSRFRCRSSLADTRYASLLSSRTPKNWLPSLTAPIGRYTLGSQPTSSHFESIDSMLGVYLRHAVVVCLGKVTWVIAKN